MSNIPSNKKTGDQLTAEEWNKAAQAINELDEKAYVKPTTGIPKSDLQQNIKESLDNADTAYQKPSTGIPASDMEAGVIPDISGKQDKINDLDEIRDGAAAGATAIQPSEMEEAIEAVNPFAGEVDATDAERLQALANVSNQTANSTTGKMGYKVLDPTKTFTEQVTAENTIYEIRDVFDLGGSDISVPSNVTFIFSGGKIINGTVTNSDNSINVESIPSDTLTAGVFSNGYNFNGDTLYAENIGMIPNLAAKASINDDILGVVVNSKKNIVINDYYYLSQSFEIDYNFKASGSGTIHKTVIDSPVFVPLENCSLFIEGLTFDQGFVIDKQDIDYDINQIQIKNTNIIGNCRLIDIRLKSDSASKINKVLVEDCYFNTERAEIMIPDGCIVDEFIIKNNIVDKFGGTFLWYSNIDESDENLALRTDSLIVEGNNVRSIGVHDNSNYYTFVLAATNKFIYKNNVIKDIIGVGSGVTYDSYASCIYYECIGNVFENVCQMPSTGALNTTISEIFKSKGNGGKRIAMNNSWLIDFSVARKICSDNNVVFTDEQFDAIAHEGFLGFTSWVDVEFMNNRIEIKNGRLHGEASSRLINNIYFENNVVITEKPAQFPVINVLNHSDVEQIVIIKNNSFKGTKNWFHYNYNELTNQPAYIIENNTFDDLFYIPIIRKGIGSVKNNRITKFSTNSVNVLANLNNYDFCELYDASIRTGTPYYTRILNIKDCVIHSYVGANSQNYINISGETSLYYSIEAKDNFLIQFKYDYANKQITTFDGTLICNVPSTSWDYATIIDTTSFAIKCGYQEAVFYCRVFNKSVSDSIIVKTSVKYPNNSLAWDGTAWVNVNSSLLNDYTISLTGVTSSNNAQSVKENSSYLATLTADSGYSLSSVVVTMNSIDITSTVYNSTSGVVYIPSVTGNVAITASPI